MPSLRVLCRGVNDFFSIITGIIPDRGFQKKPCRRPLITVPEVTVILFISRVTVGDFGLARWQPDGETGVETRVIGTLGYLAPEYAQSGQITEKADVIHLGWSWWCSNFTKHSKRSKDQSKNLSRSASFREESGNEEEELRWAQVLLLRRHESGSGTVDPASSPRCSQDGLLLLDDLDGAPEDSLSAVAVRSDVVRLAVEQQVATTVINAPPLHLHR
ncbi:hypothetical protein RHMOL_Rhmol02G0310900 [Rhododendron molle]|uniref:Uncharacterized protein n=1 Tax=Rhododendron molle TaxID=49168 RepID=A0ACC0PVZ0_RHOML|nr:hypothetical protein RHMOL_Rhmol02G0310900 [Rhododendron molle]